MVTNDEEKRKSQSTIHDIYCVYIRTQTRVAQPLHNTRVNGCISHGNSVNSSQANKPISSISDVPSKFNPYTSYSDMTSVDDISNI